MRMVYSPEVAGVSPYVVIAYWIECIIVRT